MQLSWGLTGVRTGGGVGEEKLRLLALGVCVAQHDLSPWPASEKMPSFLSSTQSLPAVSHTILAVGKITGPGQNKCRRGTKGDHRS